MSDWPFTTRGASIELAVACTDKGSHSHPSRLLQHFILDATGPAGSVQGMVVKAPQQQHGIASPRVHPVNEWGVIRLQCPDCGVDVQSRRETVEAVLRTLAEDPETVGRVITVEPETLARLAKQSK